MNFVLWLLFLYCMFSFPLLGYFIISIVLVVCLFSLPQIFTYFKGRFELWQLVKKNRLVDFSLYFPLNDEISNYLDRGNNKVSYGKIRNIYWCEPLENKDRLPDGFLKVVNFYKYVDAGNNLAELIEKECPQCVKLKVLVCKYTSNSVWMGKYLASQF